MNYATGHRHSNHTHDITEQKTDHGLTRATTDSRAQSPS